MRTTTPVAKGMTDTEVILHCGEDAGTGTIFYCGSCTLEELDKRKKALRQAMVVEAAAGS